MKLTVVSDLYKKITLKEERLAFLYTKSKSAPKSGLDGLPHGTTETSRTESLATKIVDTEGELENLRDEYAAASFQLVSEINQRVSGKAATVLFRHYVMLEPFTQIAEELELAPSSVSKLHRHGVKQFYAPSLD